LRSIIEEVARKAGIPTPDIVISNEKRFYASANSFADPKIIAVDEEIVKLFLWNKDGIKFLKALLAHEMGHIFFNHNNAKIKEEHQADGFAVDILEEPETLHKMLALPRLGGSLFVALQKQNALPAEYLSYITYVLANYAIDTIPGLGVLSKVTSFKAFIHIIKNVIASSMPLDHGHEMEHLFDKVTKKLHDICADHQAVQEACRKFSNYEGKEDHPAPLPRDNHIIACIKKKTLRDARP